MSNYIPTYRKKMEVCSKRESQLLRAIANKARPERIKWLIEEVRAARLRVLEAKRSQVPPAFSLERTEELSRIDALVTEWIALSPEQIVEKCRIRAGRHRHDTGAQDGA